MRAFVVLALAACGGSNPENVPCGELIGARVDPGNIVSGQSTFAVTWVVSKLMEREFHGAIANADGTVGPDIRLDEAHEPAAVGNTTVLWSRKTGLALQRGGILTEIASSAVSPTLAFDGTRYHVFWGHALQHQTIDEDGMLGPVNALGVSADVFEVATDRAGTTFLQARRLAGTTTGYIVDASGALRLIFEGTSMAYGQPFLFAGKAYIVHTNNGLIELTTETMTAPTLRDVEDLAGTYYPTSTWLYLLGTQSVTVFDTSIAHLGRMPARFAVFPIGTVEDDTVRFENIAATSQDPPRVELVREGRAGEVWRRTLATGSLDVDESCDGRD